MEGKVNVDVGFGRSHYLLWENIELGLLLITNLED
jgi:hypothetical protein